MKSFQIVAGKVPPATAIPCTFSIGISPPGYPTHTVVSSCGVKPENQASAWLSVVPVLPAEGRPK
jgi:hypothetical protein